MSSSSSSSSRVGGIRRRNWEARVGGDMRSSVKSASAWVNNWRLVGDGMREGGSEESACVAAGPADQVRVPAEIPRRKRKQEKGGRISRKRGGRKGIPCRR